MDVCVGDYGRSPGPPRASITPGWCTSGVSIAVAEEIHVPLDEDIIIAGGVDGVETNTNETKTKLFRRGRSAIRDSGT